jgi:tetratricopeptide (TPR) repeat protein
VTRAGLACLGLAVACAGGGSDVERQGDAHYRGGRFGEALVAYRHAADVASSPQLWAKLGAAALAAGDPETAIAAYRELGLAEPSRGAEAARGLERALRITARGGDSLGVAERAVAALRLVSPERPLGRMAASAAAHGPGVTEPELLSAAVAGALAGEEVDGLLLRSADALRGAASCEPAVKVYRTLARRAEDSATRAMATTGLGDCALVLGGAALAADRVEDAERWFDTAARADSTGPAGLLARLGWGDARLRQGDVLGAALVWQAVRSLPGAPDSVVRLANERLESLAGAAGPPGAERESE